MNILYAYHFSRSENIGDSLASPLRYVDFNRPVRVVNLLSWDTLPSHGDVIAGGGGLFFADTAMIQLLATGKHKRIVWGAGTNHIGEKELIHPEWLDDFDLVSVRDRGGRFECVPGPSCLHLEFKVQRPSPTHEFVIYEHGGNPIDVVAPDIPRMSNYAHPDDMWGVLDHLASGSVVLSNSYHGCYWAALLGRKVACFEPDSNRFLFTPWKMTFCDRKNWRQKIAEAISPEFTLTDAVEANLRFRNKVEEVLFQ